MSSPTQKKLLIPGLAIVGIILLYTLYSFSSTEGEPYEQDLSNEQTSASSLQKKDKTADVTSQPNDPQPEQLIKDDIVEIAAVQEPEIQQEEPNEPITEQSEETQEANDIIFVEGKTKDYIVKFPSELSKEPVLVQFFSYWCPHCNNFEPTVRLWEEQKPDSVKLLKIPVVFGRDDWRLAAKSYYTAVELGMANEFSRLMFRTIHVDKSYPQNEADIGKIFAKLGVSKAKFSEAAKSFNVDSNLRKAEYLTKKYKVAGVPYFLINFKYEAAEASYESQEAMFKLWNNLPVVDFE